MKSVVSIKKRSFTSRCFKLKKSKNKTALITRSWLSSNQLKKVNHYQSLCLWPTSMQNIFSKVTPCWFDRFFKPISNTFGADVFVVIFSICFVFQVISRNDYIWRADDNSSVDDITVNCASINDVTINDVIVYWCCCFWRLSCLWWVERIIELAIIICR